MMSPFGSLAASKPLELREKHKVSQHLHFLVESALFWQIAKAPGVGAAQRFAKNEDSA